MELLSPVGDFSCLQAAVQNGADSVYLGSSSFNARAGATNFNFDELNKAITYAKLRGVKVFLTLNTLVKNNEFSEAVEIARQAYTAGIDAIIVQDIGLGIYLIKKLPDLPIHASTQMTIHNLEGCLELEKLHFKRVVLSRELSLNEIDYIIRNSKIETECFIHGALCFSYSGQCLFSSIVGARSGNRGKCAGPCRLPYELLRKEDSTYTKIDTGYLLNTKDLCGLDFIPDLVEAGVKSLKIEGRLKTPEYVATVTKIYRKYINKCINNEEYIIEDDDRKALLLAFNRGGFSNGHLSNDSNRELVYKNKPSHTGIFLGNVSSFNPNKGYIKLQLNESLSIGDTVSVQREEHKYTISEIIQDKKTNMNSANIDDIVQVGRIKGNIKLGDKIYKLSSKTLSDDIKAFYSEENKKIKLNAKITLKADKPIVLEVSTLDNKLKVTANSIVFPCTAINKPINKETVITHLSKTRNTVFEFEKINVLLTNNLFVPNIKILNELRRQALTELEEKLTNKFKRNSDLVYTNSFSKNKTRSKPHISVLLRTMRPEYDYNDLENIDNVYIPLKYFADNKLEEALSILSNKFNMYIYMPRILKGNYKNIFKNNISESLNKYRIKGFIISNIADVKLLENYKGDYEFIGNYTLNVFNSESIGILKKIGINKVTLSPELDKATLEELCDSINIPKELIVFGRLPLMISNYCLLGKANKCYPDCSCKCKNDSYYIKDRLGFIFKVIIDQIQTTSTIFNSKITSIQYESFNADSVRIDIIDKTTNEVNYIVNTVKTGKRFEGQNYTNGNLNKIV